MKYGSRAGRYVHMEIGHAAQNIYLQVDPSSYDLLVLPGGKAPAMLRKNEELLAIVRQFFTEGKTVASI